MKRCEYYDEITGSCHCRTKEAEKIDQLVEALKPFTHPDLSQILEGNCEGDDSIVFQRNKAILRIGDFRKALKAAGEEV